MAHYGEELSLLWLSIHCHSLICLRYNMKQWHCAVFQPFPCLRSHLKGAQSWSLLHLWFREVMTNLTFWKYWTIFVEMKPHNQFGERILLFWNVVQPAVKHQLKFPNRYCMWKQKETYLNGLQTRVVTGAQHQRSWWSPASRRLIFMCQCRENTAVIYCCIPFSFYSGDTLIGSHIQHFSDYWILSSSFVVKFPIK